MSTRTDSIKAALPVGKVIRTLRESGGMTTHEFGALVGLRPLHVRQMEGGFKSVTFPTLARISRATKIPVWRIIRKAETLNGNTCEQETV